MGKANELPIGVFDSGLGGLTVAREIMRNLPMEVAPDHRAILETDRALPEDAGDQGDRGRL